MWIEAMLSRDEIAQLLRELMPLRVLLGEDAKNARSLSLTEPKDITLVPGVGLRMVCRAVIVWPVLGVKLPVTLSSLGILLLPSIAVRAGKEQLAFRIELEHADLVGAPAWFDARLTELINKEMNERQVQLSWDFLRTLTHSFTLPDMLEPVEKLDLHGEHGKVTIAEDALRLRVDFRMQITRPPSS